MSQRLKEFCGNLALSVFGLLLALVFLEFVVFGLILKPDDLLENVTVNGVVRYKPGSVAVFRHPGGLSSRVTINAEGWNSVKPHYPLAKTPGRVRVAVIGDSYVHGAFVNVEVGFPNIVEQNLQTLGHDVEVFRFGMDGAPLSQYLNVLRAEVLAFKPDVVVIPLIHNDFDESYRFLRSRYSSSFMKVKVDANGRVVEVPASDFRRGAADFLRRFATFRYLYYETGLYLKAKGIVSALFWGGNESYSPEYIQSAVDIRKIKDHDSNRLFARYVLGEMQKLSQQHDFELVVVMDGVREAVYAGKAQSDFEVGKLNAIAADITADLGITFLDLQGAFEREYQAAGKRFEFPFDWHWNVEGNKIVAKAVTSLLLRSTVSFAGDTKTRKADVGVSR